MASNISGSPLVTINVSFDIPDNLEPARAFAHVLLRHARLPFRHAPVWYECVIPRGNPGDLSQSNLRGVYFFSSSIFLPSVR